MSQPPLFFDIAQQNDERIAALLSWNNPGPLQISDEQRELLRELQFHKGKARAVRVSDIERKCNLSRRAVLNASSELWSMFGVAIGSNRSSTDGGLYLIVTDEELSETLNVYIGEIRTLAARIRPFRSKHYMAELFGQLRAEFAEEEARDAEAR